MKRRDFLTFIPSISSIPFLATSIEQKENKIEIINPTPSIIPQGNLGDFNLWECTVEIKHKGMVIGQGYPVEINIENFMFNDTIQGGREIELRAKLNDLIYPS